MQVKRAGRSLLIIGGAVVVALLGAPRAHADAKFGYIDSTRLLAEYKGFEDAKHSFEQEVGVWKKEEEGMRSELDSLLAEYKSQNLMLTEATKKEKEATLKEKKAAYEDFVQMTFGPEGKVAQKDAELTKPILDKVNALLQKIGADENYTMIFDAASGGLLYANTGSDLTNRVLEELNKGTQ